MCTLIILIKLDKHTRYTIYVSKYNYKFKLIGINILGIYFYLYMLYLNTSNI